MGLKAWWRRWEPEHQETLGGIALVVILLVVSWALFMGGYNDLQDGLLKDGYNIALDTSKSAGDGRYIIQTWYDGQWNDVLRCGE